MREPGLNPLFWNPDPWLVAIDGLLSRIYRVKDQEIKGIYPKPRKRHLHFKVLGTARDVPSALNGPYIP